jgi:hypothetical protein
MPFVSVTRLRLRGWRFLPQFVWHAQASARQARRAPGHLALDLRREPGNVYWTVSAWASEADMRAFMIAGAHREVMPKLMVWCDEAAVAHREQPDATLPDAAAALQILTAQGRLSKVNFPSAAHRAGRVAGDATP